MWFVLMIIRWKTDGGGDDDDDDDDDDCDGDGDRDDNAYVCNFAVIFRKYLTILTLLGFIGAVAVL